MTKIARATVSEMNRNQMIERLKKDGYKAHHTSKKRGYISRKENGYDIYPYAGRFGKGYAMETPTWKSTRYCDITYWIK